MSITKANQDILQKANAAIAAGDHEGFLSFCTSDTEWTFVGDQVLKGKQAVREYMAAAYIVPPIVTVDRFIEEGDHLTVTGEITLADKNGNATQYAYCDIWRIENGKLAAVRAFVIEIK